MRVKVDMNSEILLQTSAIFLLSNVYLKHGIGSALADLGEGCGGCNPPPPFGQKILSPQKGSFFAIFRSATPLSGPNGGQK